MLWILEQNLGLRAVCLCLDHDEAGIEASGRLADILHERGYDDVGMLQPEHKDWNEDLKAGRGLPAQEAEEHPQLIASSEVCGKIGVCMKDSASRSLQMMERPLMTPDELKSIPKGQFVVMKTGTHPMQTRLRLFLDWGISFGEPYLLPERAARSGLCQQTGAGAGHFPLPPRTADRE